MKITAYKAVLFDFDYTLANSEAAILRCFHAVLQNHGFRRADDEIARTIGNTLEEAFGVLMGEYDPEHLTALRKEYVAIADACMVQMTEFYPGAAELLEQLHRHGMMTGIVTTKYRYRVQASFERFHWEHLIDSIVGGEDVSCHKPDPEGILLWLTRGGISAKDALYVGDHVVDAEAAARAGVSFLGIAQGQTKKEELAKFPHIAVCDNLMQVIQFIIRQEGEGLFR